MLAGFARARHHPALASLSHLPLVHQPGSFWKSAPKFSTQCRFATNSRNSIGVA